MSFTQQIENEQYEAAYNPADKFAGFDRGDIGRDELCDNGSRVIGRMTNAGGQRVTITEVFYGDFSDYEVAVDGDRVHTTDDRAHAVAVAKWWMAGCPA